MGNLGVFSLEERLKQVRGLLTDGEVWWLSKLSKRSNVPANELKGTIDKYFAGVLKKEKAGKIKYLHLSDGRGELEKKCYERADAVREALRLRPEGYSYLEIERKVLESHGVHLDSSVLSAYLRGIELSGEGKARLNGKIKGDRSRAGRKGGLQLKDSGLLWKNQEKAAAAAVCANTKKLPESSKKISLDKVNVIAHCMFDGFVYKKSGYSVLGYVSVQKDKIVDFIGSVNKVYGLSTGVERRLNQHGEIFCCRFASKEAVKDLLRYSPSYSTRANTAATVPSEIMNGPENFKKTFLRAFWDDEGAVMCSVTLDKRGYGHYHKKLEAYCENPNVLKQLLQLHKDVGVDARINRKRICISNRGGVKGFYGKIGFSPNSIVNAKRSVWYKMPKQKLVEYMLEIYDKKPRVCITTYGCSSNKADTAKIFGYLKKMGVDIALDEGSADIAILNSCGVKQPTEDKILRHAKDLSVTKKVIMGGCLPKMIGDVKKKVPGISGVFDNTSIPTVVGLVVEAVLQDYGFASRISNEETKCEVQGISISRLVVPVQISQGCINFCLYCSTKLARGNLKSCKQELLLDEIRASVKNGAKEIWLTSQDNGCYGFDIGTNLAELLKDVVEIPGDFRVRVGMMNPQHILRFLDDLIEIYKSPKVFKFAHIPVQSGSDKVLREMARGYTTKDFEKIVAAFRKEMDLTVSTDIIVGFPTESEKDFRETVELLKRTKPDFLNLSRYWPRKGTRAGEMKQLPRDLVAERSKEVAELYAKLLKEKNKKTVGQICSVTFTEERDGFSVGRNSLYKPVLVKEKGLLGKTLDVKIIASRKSELVGKII